MVNDLARSLGATFFTYRSRIVAHFQNGAGLQIPCYVQRHGFTDKARPQKLLPRCVAKGRHRHCVVGRLVWRNVDEYLFRRGAGAPRRNADSGGLSGHVI
jgi:hypothetical protein